MRVRSLILTASFAGLLAGVAAADPILYDNTGPGTATTGGEYFGPIASSAVTDSFTLSVASMVTGVDFLVDLSAGDTLKSLNWAITSAAFGGTIYASASNVAPTETSVCSGCEKPGDIDGETFSVPSVDLAAGTYWLELDNGLTTISGNSAFWDVSKGPSVAEYSDTGSGDISIPSETFQILGQPLASPVPEPSSMALLASVGGTVLFALRRKRLV